MFPGCSDVYFFVVFLFFPDYTSNRYLQYRQLVKYSKIWERLKNHPLMGTWNLCIGILLCAFEIFHEFKTKKGKKETTHPGPCVCVVLCVYFWEVTLGIFSSWLPCASICRPTPRGQSPPHQPLDCHLLFRGMAYTWLGSCVSPWVWEPWALDHSHHLAPLNLKNSHNLKVDSYVLFSGKF